MENTTKTQTVSNLPVCEFCKKAGNNGALWLVSFAGLKSQRVHKPCGEILRANAPEGVVVTLEPSQDQRVKWRQERQAREAAKFWEGAGLKLPKPPVEQPQLAEAKA